MEKISAAIVGLGRIASLLEEDSLREKPCTHAGALAANPGCVLAAGCDIDGDRRRLFAEKWQVPVYADAVEMLRVHAPQILVIATHPDSHYYYCRLAAGAGVPVIICEKPLADNISEARKIARFARQGELAKNGTVIITNHERRYANDYIRARAILAEAALGKLLSVRAVLYMGKNKRLLDVLWHDGTHLADALMFLANRRLKHRRRRGARLSARAGTAWLEGALCAEKPAEPVPVIIEIGAGRDHLVFEMEFSCEKGRLRIGNGIFEVWESAPSPYAEKFRSLKQTGEVFTGPTGYFANMVQDAVSCVKEPGKQPCSGAADGLKVIEYLNSVDKWRQEK
ncbi:MAG: Gfo/Idh/MocA family oxidoreductase [Treponema sp.]|jgi:predicted dehydrogenase|nr:Gfo/Idh/MocA family oxidoreductase [Treponema sp.]